MNRAWVEVHKTGLSFSASLSSRKLEEVTSRSRTLVSLGQCRGGTLLHQVVTGTDVPGHRSGICDANVLSIVLLV